MPPDPDLALDPTGTTPTPQPSSRPDATPLEADRASFATHRVRLPEHQVLEIAPSAQGYTFALAFVAIGVGMLALAWWRSVGDFEGLTAAASGLVFLFGGILLLLTPEKHVFDRHEGVYRRSTPWRRPRTIPLASIRGVQLLSGPYGGEKGGGSRGQADSHQLNLVLDGPEAPRRNILDHGDGDAAVQVGRELAGFLGVPMYVHAR